MAKSDLLAECNNLKAPLQDFAEAFCSRCLQGDCTRSQSGKSRFEQRVSTWEERLFTNVVRMNQKDERFSRISAQNFVSLRTSSSGDASSWVDPRSLESSKAFSIPSQELLQPAIEAPVPESAPNPRSLESPVESPALGLVNTPNRSGQMIGGDTQKPSSLVSDPWQSIKPTQPLRPGEVIVKPGAKIKLGP